MTFSVKITELFAKTLAISILYRGKKPLNGITTTSSMEAIMDAAFPPGKSTQELEQEGKNSNLGRRQDERDLEWAEPEPRNHARDLTGDPECKANGARDLSVAVGAAVRGHLPSMIRNRQACLEIDIGEQHTMDFGNIGKNPVRILMSLIDPEDDNPNIDPQALPFA